jgi:hypothetical protein
MAESEADWERRREPVLPETPAAASRRLRLQGYLWGVVALLLLLATGGYWWWRSVQAGSHQAEAELAATAHGELGVVTQAPTPMFASHTDNLTDADWWLQHAPEAPGMPMAGQATESATFADGTLPIREIHGDQAVTRVVMYTEHGAPAYRQTRFYRRIGSEWRQTPPDAALWGPERSLEMSSFVYHFRQNDAEVVIAVASQVDALYTTMRRNVGLPIPVAREKLVIEVSVTQPPGQALSWFSAPDRIIVASPALYLAPVELSDVELLVQSLALALSGHVLAQAKEQYRPGVSWQPMLDGLGLWQVWDLDLPLAAWRTEVVTWLYTNLYSTGSRQPPVLPERYTDLCAAHTLWMPSPVQLGIPLACSELDWENWYYQSWGPRDPLLRLDQLTLWTPPDESIGQTGASYVPHPGQTVALATLVEYAVTTYGRERLPALVAGLGRYNTWDRLLPAVFGVSAAEFEAGWQAYLVTRYGVSLDTLMQ